MAAVNFYKPDASLQWIIKQFETIRYEGPDNILTDKFIPRPDAALVFHFRDIPKVIAPVDVPLRSIFIAPVVCAPNQLQIKGSLDGFIVICKATVLSRIFKLNMLRTTNMFVELPAEIFGPLWEKLGKSEQDQERIDCFSDFIRSYAPDGYQPDPIDFIYNDIVENILKFSLRDINGNSFQSISSLQRNFNKRVGVSMKRLMRLSRINYIFQKMVNDKSFNAQKIMFDGNYYDQSHFIRDFKELTGETPRQFCKHNTELCRILSGIFKEDLSPDG
jgi:AraC-like DNA-binding protein